MRTALTKRADENLRGFRLPLTSELRAALTQAARESERSQTKFICRAIRWALDNPEAERPPRVTGGRWLNIDLPEALAAELETHCATAGFAMTAFMIRSIERAIAERPAEVF